MVTVRAPSGPCAVQLISTHFATFGAGQSPTETAITIAYCTRLWYCFADRRADRLSGVNLLNSQAARASPYCFSHLQSRSHHRAERRMACSGARQVHRCFPLRWVTISAAGRTTTMLPCSLIFRISLPFAAILTGRAIRPMSKNTRALLLKNSQLYSTRFKIPKPNHPCVWRAGRYALPYLGEAIWPEMRSRADPSNLNRMIPA